MADNTKWQLIFGAILLVAVIFAVIVMILLSIGDSEPIPTPTPEPVVQTPSPTIPPTPEPIIEITSAQGLVNKNVQSGWSGHIGDTNEHSIEYFPSDAIVDIEWTSSDEDVVTVEKTGAKTADVTGVGEGNATVTAVVGTEKVEFDLIIY
jgi:Bacterial Ig-like domain (group 2).